FHPLAVVFTPLHLIGHSALRSVPANCHGGNSHGLFYHAVSSNLHVSGRCLRGGRYIADRRRLYCCTMVNSIVLSWHMLCASDFKLILLDTSHRANAILHKRHFVAIYRPHSLAFGHFVKTRIERYYTSELALLTCKPSILAG